MEKDRKKKVTAGIGVAAIAAAAIGLTAGTYAGFTDSEAGSVLDTAAGTLELDLLSDVQSTVDGILAGGGLLPGETYEGGLITMTNSGNTDGVLQLKLLGDGTNVTDCDDILGGVGGVLTLTPTIKDALCAIIEGPGVLTELLSHVQVSVVDAATDLPIVTDVLAGLLGDYNEPGVVTDGVIDLGPLNAGQSKSVEVVLEVLDTISADLLNQITTVLNGGLNLGSLLGEFNLLNLLQGDILTLDAQALLTQAP